MKLRYPGSDIGGGGGGGGRGVLFYLLYFLYGFIFSANVVMAESLSEAVKDTLHVSVAHTRGPQGGNVTFSITTDNIRVASELCKLGGYATLGTGVTTLGVLLGNRLLRPLIDDVVNVVFGYKRDDQANPDIITGESLHILLHCLTDERFLEVLEYYASGEIKELLQKEFPQIGIEVKGLDVEIENMEKLENTIAAIHERYVEINRLHFKY